MAKKSKFIKNLLTTASAVAVLTGGANVAFGAEDTTNALAVNLTGGGGLASGGALADSLKVHANNVAISTGGPIAANALDLNGKTGTTLTVGGNSSLGSFGNGTAAAVTNGVTAAVAVNDGVALTVDGTNTNSIAPVPVDTYVGLGPVTLGNGGGGGASFVINSNAGNLSTFYNTFDGNADGKGLITAKTASTFEGVIGGDYRLASVEVDGTTATFKANASANGFVLSDTGGAGAVVMTVAKGANLRAFDNAAGVAVTVAAAANAGITFDAAGAVDGFAGKITVLDVGGVNTGTIGQGNRGGDIRIKGGIEGKKTAEIAAKVNFTTLTFEGANDTLLITEGAAGDRVLNLANGIVSNGADGKGILEFGSNAKVVAEIGVANPIKEFKLGAGRVELISVGGGVSKAQSFTFNKANSELYITTTDGQVLTGDFITNGDEGVTRGTIKLGNVLNGATLVGTVGQDKKKLANIEFENDKTLTVQGPGLWAEKISGVAGGNQGTLVINGSNVDGKFMLSASSSTNAGDHQLTALTIDTSLANGATIATVDGTIRTAVTNLTAGQDHQLILAENAHLISTNTNFNAANQELHLGEGSIVEGNLVSVGVGGKGKVYVDGSSRIKGDNAGAGGGNALNTIIFSKDDKKTLTREAAGAATYTKLANGLDFQKDGELRFEGDFAHTLEAAVKVAAGAAEGLGTISYASNIAVKALLIKGAIGEVANGKRLHSLVNASTSELTLEGGDVHINTYTAGRDSTLKLNEAGATYKFDHFEANGQGTLKISKDINLETKHYDDDAAEFTATRLSEIQFGGDRTATIKDGSLLRAANLNPVANANGTLNFEGDAVFEANMDTAGNALNAIQVRGAAGKIVDYRSSAKVNGAVEFHDAGTFKFSGEKLVAADIVNKAPNKGTIEFARPSGSQTIDSDVNVDKVVFSGRDIALEAGKEFKAAATEFTFKSDEAMAVNVLQSDIDQAVFKNESNAKHTIKFDNNNGARNLSGNLGGDKALVFETNGTDFTVSATANAANAEFTTDTADNGVMTLDVGGAALAGLKVKVSSIGTKEKAFAEVKFTRDGEVRNDLWSNKVTVEDSKTATLGGALGVGTLAANNNEVQVGKDATIVFNREDFVLNHTVKNKVAANQGNARFGDINSTIAQDLGTNADSLKEVKFAFATGSAKVAKLQKAVYANDVTLENGTLKADAAEDVGVSGNFTVKDAAIDLGLNTFQRDNGDTTFSGNVAINVTHNGTAGGQFVNADGDMNANADAEFTINLFEQTTALPREEVTFTLIKNDGNAVTDATRAKLAAADLNKNGNTLTEWTFKVDSKGNLVLTRENRAAEKLRAIVDAVTNVKGNKNDINENLRKIIAAPKGTPAGDLADELAKLATTDIAKFAEALERITSSIEGANNENSEHAQAQVHNRLFSVGLPAAGVADQVSPALASDDTSYSGISAGDDHTKYGVWATPFYSNSTQKARKNAPGYKGESFGFSAGFDAKVNDELLIGAALTYSTADLKHKDAKRGDKTRLDSYLFSVYGSQQLTNNWFLLGSATVGSNQAKNDSIRVTSAGNQTARGKYNSMSFTGELLAGYNYAMNDFALTPMAGFRYSRVNDSGYTETGTTNQNLQVSKKATDKFDVIAGLRVAGKAYEMDGLSVTPEAHAFVSHDLINKNAAVVTKLDGASSNLSQTSAKPVRTSYNLGLGVNATYGMMEYGATYDAYLADKFVGHQGALKVRVNF